MTDVIDRGSEREESDREYALQETALKAKRDAMPFKGECYNCEAVIARGCFCDGDCRDDFERSQRAKKLSGRD